MTQRLCCSLLSVVAICVAQAAAAQQPVILRYTFHAGQRFVVSYEETNANSNENSIAGSKTQSSSSQRCTETWIVRNVTPGGAATLDVTFDSVIWRERTEAGGDFVFDLRRSLFEANPSLKASTGSERAELERADAFRKWTADVFLARKMTFTVSPTGTVTDVIGFGDEAWDMWRARIGAIITDKSERARLDSQVEALFGAESVARVFSYAFFVGLPTQAVSVGQEWSGQTTLSIGSVQLPMTRRYKLVGVSGTTMRIAERIVYDPPVVPDELAVRQNENLMTADVTLDPAAGTILSRAYVGIADMDVYQRDPTNPRKVSRSITSVRGSVRISKTDSNSSYDGTKPDPVEALSLVKRGVNSGYSATVVWSNTVRGGRATARVLARGNKVRVDLMDEPSGGPGYLLLDKDTQVVSAVFPSRRVYLRESTLTGTSAWATFVKLQAVVFNTATPCDVFPGASSCTYIGEGTLTGRRVKTWEVVQAVDGRIPVGHVWVDAQLSVLMKAETPGGFIELQDIKEEVPSETLFRIPADYRPSAR